MSAPQTIQPVLLPEIVVHGKEPSINQLYNLTWLAKGKCAHDRGKATEHDLADSILQTVRSIKNPDERRTRAIGRLKAPLSPWHSHIAGSLWRIVTEGLTQQGLDELKHQFSWTEDSPAYRLIWVHCREASGDLDDRTEILRAVIKSIADLRWGVDWEAKIGLAYPVTERNGQKGGQTFWKTLRACTWVKLNESSLAALETIKTQQAAQRTRQKSQLTEDVLRAWKDLYVVKEGGGAQSPNQDRLDISLAVARNGQAEGHASTGQSSLASSLDTPVCHMLPAGSISGEPQHKRSII